LDAGSHHLFGKVGKELFVEPIFHYDRGANIEVNDHFLVIYNATTLDIAKVTIGNDAMIGSKTMNCTVNHPIIPKERRDHLRIASPVIIGNDVD
jgi:maltose O-acetyltransferase